MGLHRYGREDGTPMSCRLLSNSAVCSTHLRARANLKTSCQTKPGLSSFRCDCNVKDDCVFPALSKHVSREQGLSNGSQVYQPDELWAAVKKCWDEFPMDTLARSYVRHSQIASALALHKGTDNFVRERGGIRLRTFLGWKGDAYLYSRR